MKRILVYVLLCLNMWSVTSENNNQQTMRYSQKKNRYKKDLAILYTLQEKKSKVFRGSIEEILFFCRTLSPYHSFVPVTLEKETDIDL